MELVFEIPGPPTPKDRPRRGKQGHFYTPARTKQAEAEIALIAKSKRVVFGDNKVAVQLRFHTASWKGDGDNFEKLILDSLQKAKVFVNDSQVRRVQWEILDCAPGREKTEVRVEEM